MRSAEYGAEGKACAPAVLHNRRGLAQFSLAGLTIVDGHIIPLSRADVDLRQRKARVKGAEKAAYLPRAPNLYTAFLQHHLTPVRKPAHNAGHHKQNREEIQREAWRRARE